MHSQKSGYFILGIGIFIAFFSLAADTLGFGEGGVQAAQILGAQVGVVIALLGWGIILTRRTGELNASTAGWKSLARIPDLPVIVWVILGFLIIYFLLFIFPLFFNPLHRIQYFNRFIPEVVPIGRDLTYSTNSIRDWLVFGQELYDAEYHVYPPLYAIVFAPLLLLNYPANYYFVTAFTLGSMLVLIFLIPVLVKVRNNPSLLVFFFLTVIVSYGMQFEFERGQFNVIAFMLSLLAIYLFHYHESFRHLAYLIFSVSIHLKIYPGLLVFMFVKDWRDWKGNLIRFMGLGAFNIALLFVLGASAFADFVRVISAYSGATWSRPYNHSIRSFVYGLAHSEPALLSPGAAAWLDENLLLVEVLFAAYFLLCVLAVLTRHYKNGGRGINYDLLLVCTIGAMIIPSVSIDYKLPLLAPALAMALSHRSMQARGPGKVASVLLVTIVSAAYSVTLFPFIDRPSLLANSLPMLMIILTAIALLNFLDDRAPDPAPMPADSNAVV